MNLKGIMKSLGAKPGQVVSDPYARAFAPQISEAEQRDHEVSMAKGSLEAIVKHANELMGKLGNDEKDIPGWIQDHIAKSENFIQQANDQYHEYGKNESVNEDSLNEDAPIYKDWDEFVNPHYIIVHLKDGKKLRISRSRIKGGSNAYHAILKAFNDNNYKITNKLVSAMLDKLRDDAEDGKELGRMGAYVSESVKEVKFDEIKVLSKEEFQNEVAGDTYVVYLVDGEGNKKKVKETAGKTNAIRIANRLMTSSKIEGAGWMSAEAWQKEPFKVS